MMNTPLNHMVALERSRDRDRKIEVSRAAPIATPATSKNPAFTNVERLGIWWQLQRRLRPT
jgi:hypothetical protein